MMREEEDDDNQTTAAAASSMKKLPAWLQGLMAETFFAACGVHRNLRKNEKNIFCLNCCLSFCPHCLSSHNSSHLLLQVRRYLYQDVIRMDDLEKLINCSYIQPYTINSAKVIFLNQRTQSRTSCSRGSSCNPCCFTCDRILQDTFHFCSLSCKVDHMAYQGEDLSSIFHRFDESDFAVSQFEGLRVDVSSDPNAYGGASNYETGSSESGFVRMDSKIKVGFVPDGIMLSLSSRRKGSHPQRSPLS